MKSSRSTIAAAAMAAAVILAAGLTGCVPTQRYAAQDKALVQMQDDVQRLKREMSDLKGGSGGTASEAGKKLAELDERLGSAVDEFKAARGKIEELEYAVKQGSKSTGATSDEAAMLRAELKDLTVRLDALTRRVSEVSGAVEKLAASPAPASAPATGGAAKPAQPKPKPQLGPQELYDQAYGLYREGKYDGAKEKFRDYIARFPDTSLTDNAHFWIGEAYYDQGKYEQSILQYDKVVQKFPEGDKVASALLKQAFAFSAIGSDLDARILLKKVVEQHPGTEQAGIAKKKLSVLKKN